MDDKRTKQIRLILSDSEKEAIERAANKSGLRPGTYGRMKLLEAARKDCRERAKARATQGETE